MLMASNRIEQMMDLARRHPKDVVFESSLRKGLIKAGMVVEFSTGESCMQAGCELCVVAACPTCNRVGRVGDVIFLVDREPNVLMGDQAVTPHANEPKRDF